MARLSSSRCPFLRKKRLTSNRMIRTWHASQHACPLRNAAVLWHRHWSTRNATLDSFVTQVFILPREGLLVMDQGRPAIEFGANTEYTSSRYITFSRTDTRMDKGETRNVNVKLPVVCKETFKFSLSPTNIDTCSLFLYITRSSKNKTSN